MSDDLVYESTCGAFAELVAHGVTTAIVSPGSRSTALAIAARWTQRLDVQIHLDERSAAFYALGMAKASRRPVVLVCTSGTASANYLPAVVEAHYSGVPLIVFTADRPAELRDWGAGQTIDQVDIYGSHVRWAAEMATVGETDPQWYRRMAARAVREATAPRPGPVHLNWPFREPLEPTAKPEVSISPTVELTEARPSPTPAEIELMTRLSGFERGLIVAGPSDFDSTAVRSIGAFAARAGWPIMAEPGSQLRFGQHTKRATVIGTADQLLRVGEWSTAHVPDVVLRIGDSPTCKPFRLWIETNPAPHHVLIDPDGRWNEASFTTTHVVSAEAALLLAVVECDRGTTAWTESWASAEAKARAAIDQIVDSEPMLEASVARTVGREMTGAESLYVSNSMPVRDLDSFAGTAAEGPTVYSNRGASGIDGLVSCANGVAATGSPTVLYIGDIATLHDVGGLLQAARDGNTLTLVIPNNDGGGIFSFLPVAQQEDVNFDELFHTPHGTDLSQLGAITGVRHTAVGDVEALIGAPRQRVQRPGVDIIEIPIDRDANLAQHRAISAAVTIAIT